MYYSKETKNEIQTGQANMVSSIDSAFNQISVLLTEIGANMRGRGSSS